MEILLTILTVGAIIALILYGDGYWEVTKREEVSNETYEAALHARETGEVIETYRVTQVIERVTYGSGRQKYKTHKYYVPIPNEE